MVGQVRREEVGWRVVFVRKVSFKSTRACVGLEKVLLLGRRAGCVGLAIMRPRRL